MQFPWDEDLNYYHLMPRIIDLLWQLKLSGLRPKHILMDWCQETGFPFDGSLFQLLYREISFQTYLNRKLQDQELGFMFPVIMQQARDLGYIQ